MRKPKHDPAGRSTLAGGAVTTAELLEALGATRRARKILRPYVAGLFTQGDFTLERIDTCLAEAQLRLEEVTPKPPPGQR